MTPPHCYLVFGASGFIGSHVLRELKARGQTVIGTRASSPIENLESFDLRSDRLADLLSRCRVTPETPLIAVVCSAISQIDRCFREWELSYEINVERTRTLLEDLASLGAYVVFLSTTHVFDGLSGNYDENSPIHPLSEYGKQKAAIEDYLGSSDQESLVLRLDKIVGGDPAERHLFSEWHELLKANRPIRCTLGQVFSPTLVDDVAKAIWLVAEKHLTGLYHVANQEAFSRTELAELFCSLAGTKAEVITLPQADFGFADDRPLKTNLDSRRFIDATGMQFTPMRTVIERFLRSLSRPS